MRRSSSSSCGSKNSSDETNAGGVELAWSPEDIKRLRKGRPKALGVGANGVFEKPATGLGYVAAGLAHDLNNVLAPIITSIEVLRLHCGSAEKSQEILSMIERHVRQGPFLVQQILSFAQGVECDHAYLHPAFLLRSLKKQIGETFPPTIKVEFKTTPDLWPVLGSLADLHEALSNLCVNAREAMPQGGRLLVSAENVELSDEYPFIQAGTSRARHVLFKIKDTGPGVPEDLLEQIFEAKFSTKGPDRLGLGLFRSNQVALAHSGQLTVQSDPGAGATFCFYLPVAPGTLPSLSPGDAQLLRGHGEEILVIEDEEVIRAVTRRTFETFGYRVITTTNGADAVSAYRQGGDSISLVFTDMNMPIMDGAMTIQALRDINPKVKIIATSGLNARGQIERASDAGANHFIPKPYTAVHLLKLVQQTLNPTASL